MENLTVKLLSPVEFDAVKYEELQMRELIVDEQIALEKENANKLIIEQDKAFFALTCGVPPQVIGRMKSRDWARLKNHYWSTLGNAELPPLNSDS